MWKYEFYNMDPLYNYTPINKLVVAIFIVRKKEIIAYE
jgi:hypothetical protein